MASADVQRELDCSVCLSIYTDPVMIKCGHNFCRECIDHILDTQEAAGPHYSCPECREEFLERPALQNMIKLRNIAKAFQSVQPNQEETGIVCTYCVDSTVPAVKFCLNCDASLCDKHLRAHSKAPEHVLTAPTTALQNRKCSTHKKILEYYCTQDSTCICVSCCLIGMHKGHQVESLDEASERKKNELINVMQKLMTKMEENEKRVRDLQKELRKEQEEASGVTERVTGLFRDLQRQLEDLEKRVLSEISRQAEQASLRVSNLIHQLELEKQELLRKVHCMEELKKVMDPYDVLQQSADLCDIEERDNGERQTQLIIKSDLNVSDISQVLNTLSETIREVNTGMGIKRPSHLSLDVSTAGSNLMVSPDMKTVTFQYNNWGMVINQHSHVLSTQSFSSGRHYWEVDIGVSAAEWRVGMCYSSRPKEVVLGYDNKSWVLYGSGNQSGFTYVNSFAFNVPPIACAVIHNSERIDLPTTVTSRRVRIYLDYEAGQISFYDVCDPIRHLHTFTTTFTEPLHAALYVGVGSLTICGDN